MAKQLLDFDKLPIGGGDTADLPKFMVSEDVYEQVKLHRPDLLGLMVLKVLSEGTILSANRAGAVLLRKYKEDRDYADIAAKEKSDAEYSLHKKVERFEKHITTGFFAENHARDVASRLLNSDHIAPADAELVRGLLDNLSFYRKEKGWENLPKFYSD